MRQPLTVSVLDASALIAYLRREVGWDLVGDLLTDPNHTCLIHALNLCEVFYDSLRTAGEGTAQQEIRDILAAGVQPREDLDAPFWQSIARLKAAYRRISLADCCCLALAKRMGCEALTTDRTEFGPVAQAGKCQVRFIR